MCQYSVLWKLSDAIGYSRLIAQTIKDDRSYCIAVMWTNRLTSFEIASLQL
jgi:hypothetical protein